MSSGRESDSDSDETYIYGHGDTEETTDIRRK
jgi:hypothetical protein